MVEKSEICNIADHSTTRNNHINLAPYLFHLSWLKLNLSHGSVETDLRGWTLVIAVINVDVYSFLTYTDMICHLEDAGTGIFSLRLLVKIPKLEIATNSAMLRMEGCPYSFFQ